MPNKTRFQGSKTAASKTANSGGSGSKRAITQALTGVSSGKSGAVQVFLNGKIVTPHSLLPKKIPSSNQDNAPKKQAIATVPEAEKVEKRISAEDKVVKSDIKKAPSMARRCELLFMLCELM